MGKKHDQADAMDAHRDYLTDASTQFGRKDEERDFLDSIGQGPVEEDIQVNVGDRVKAVREETSALRISPRGLISVFPSWKGLRTGVWRPPWGLSSSWQRPLI